MGTGRSARVTTPNRGLRLGTVILALPLALLAGCMPLTDRTVVDEVYSFVTDRDCSTIRAMNGDYYCREHLPTNKVVETRLYCYRSLGSITCYDQPQPYQRNQQVAPAQHVIGARTERISP